MIDFTKRTSGILCHISSLPGKFGIGTMGKEAFDFVDKLNSASQTFWQILPVGPTTYGDSPYQSFSSFAGNPYFIDLEDLVYEGYLKKDDFENIVWSHDETNVDYGTLYKERNRIFEILFENFLKNIPADFDKFCNSESDWLDDYSLFMTIKDIHAGTPFYFWEDCIKLRNKNALEEVRKENERRIIYHKMLQYFFFRHWRKLKAYANSKGIYIIGDLPIYVSSDSADVWKNTELFDIDENMKIRSVAGCPPDSFSKNGQKWGNVVYNWKVHKDTGYMWWLKRLRNSFSMFDAVRIDHFRGFDSFYCVASGEKTAINGTWKDGPGIDFWNTVLKNLGNLPVVAEDLGFLTKSVKKLLQDTGFPGMKILQFAFCNDGSDYLPHNFDKNSVVYTGTHDNDTIIGWIANTNNDEIERAKKYFRVKNAYEIPEAMMLSAISCTSNTCILTLQDLIGLDSSARMNTPSTVGNNWKWRATAEQIESINFEKLKYYTKLYERA